MPAIYDGNPTPATTSQWVANTAYPTGTLICPTPANGLYYRAVSVGSGTSGASQPVWPTIIGQTVIDNAGANQITWTCQGSNVFGSTVALQVPVGTDAPVAASQTVPLQSVADWLANLLGLVTLAASKFLEASGSLAAGANTPVTSGGVPATGSHLVTVYAEGYTVGNAPTVGVTWTTVSGGITAANGITANSVAAASPVPAFSFQTVVQAKVGTTISVSVNAAAGSGCTYKVSMVAI